MKDRTIKPQQERRTMITKHYCKSIVRAALLLALTMSIIGLAPAFSTSARAGTYSVFSVSGNYVIHGDGWDLNILAGSPNTSNPSIFLPRSFVGLTTFTPATGTFHEEDIARLAGQNHSAVIDGAYTVDATGHGTMTWGGAVGPKHRDFYIVNGGTELKWIVTDPPSTFTASVAGTMTKQ